MLILYQFSGGWEIWLQCEMAWRYPLGTVMREQALWGDRRACDLVFDNGYAVELKCPGLLRLQTSHKMKGLTFGETKGGIERLVEEIIKDKKKIDEYASLSSNLHGCSMVVIPAAALGYSRLGMLLVQRGGYTMGITYGGFHIYTWRR